MCGTNGVCGYVVVRLVVNLGTLDLLLERPHLCTDFFNWKLLSAVDCPQQFSIGVGALTTFLVIIASTSI